MRKLSIYVIILLLIGVCGYFFRDSLELGTKKLVYYSTCETPRYYSIGRIDHEFGLSKAEFVEATYEASQIWNTAYGRILFTYKADAPLQVNLLYDSRQTLNTEINQMNNEVKQKDSELQPQIDEYNRKSADLKQRIQQLNAEIEASNARGGATQEEYKSLRDKQTVLQREAAELNRVADSLSLSTDSLNREISQLGQTVNSYNNALVAKPEGGRYIYDGTGERIEINLFDDRQELVHILAHEIGHALGMDHVPSEESIMFAKTNKIIIPSRDDIQELQHACRVRNRVEERWDTVVVALNEFMARFHR